MRSVGTCRASRRSPQAGPLVEKRKRQRSTSLHRGVSLLAQAQLDPLLQPLPLAPPAFCAAACATSCRPALRRRQLLRQIQWDQPLRPPKRGLRQSSRRLPHRSLDRSSLSSFSCPRSAFATALGFLELGLAPPPSSSRERSETCPHRPCTSVGGCLRPWSATYSLTRASARSKARAVSSCALWALFSAAFADLSSRRFSQNNTAAAAAITRANSQSSIMFSDQAPGSPTNHATISVITKPLTADIATLRLRAEPWSPGGSACEPS